MGTESDQPSDRVLAEDQRWIEDRLDDRQLTPEDVPMPDWQKAELNRREADRKNSTETGLSWEEVVRQIRARHGR